MSCSGKFVIWSHTQVNLSYEVILRGKFVMKYVTIHIHMWSGTEEITCHDQVNLTYLTSHMPRFKILNVWNFHSRPTLRLATVGFRGEVHDGNVFNWDFLPKVLVNANIPIMVIERMKVQELFTIYHT